MEVLSKVVKSALQINIEGLRVGKHARSTLSVEGFRTPIRDYVLEFRDLFVDHHVTPFARNPDDCYGRVITLKEIFHSPDMPSSSHPVVS